MAQRSLSLWVRNCSEFNQNENVECSSEAQDSMDYSSLPSDLQVTSNDGDQHELAPPMVKKVAKSKSVVYRYSTKHPLLVSDGSGRGAFYKFCKQFCFGSMVYPKVLMELSFQSHSQNGARQQDLQPRIISFWRINYQIHKGKLFLRLKCVMK